MQTLTKANEARTRKALDKLYRFNGTIMTLEQYINQKIVEGATFEVLENMPKYQYNRHKFNQMNYAEQREYDEKLKQTRTEYGLRHGAERFFLPVPKMVFEHYATTK